MLLYFYCVSLLSNIKQFKPQHLQHCKHYV